MKRTNTGTSSLLALSLLTLGAMAFSHVGPASHQPQRANPLAARTVQPALESYGDLPLAFEANRGQTDARADFLSHGNGYTMFFSPTELAMSFSAAGAAVRPAPLRMTLRGANPHARSVGRDRLPGTVNYLRGADPAKWHTNVATYAKVAYAGVYPGVDIVYYGNRRRLEFDFVVAPGADPSAIRLSFAGADALRVDSGELVLRTSAGPKLRLREPFVYQTIGGARHRIAGGYTLDGQGVRFRLARYDHGKPLVIDPTMAYSTRLGGRDEDAAYAIAVDPAGNAYVTGNTNSTDYPVTNPAQAKNGGTTDAFVAKLSPDGSRLLYSTYLGGSGSDVGYGIAVDAQGNAYVTGDTRSTDFPVVHPLQAKLAGNADVFVTKLSPDGSRLIYSTYVGGNNGQRGQGIGVDAAGNAYVAGYTNSTNFPVVNAVQEKFAGGNADAFVFRLNASGSALDYSTYFGGANDRPDIATAVAVDAAGNAYVTGFTNSRDFPVYKPLQLFVGPTDVFASKFNPKGALVYSTFLGGNADDEGMGIAIDAAGSAYVTGETESPSYPTTRGAFSTKCTPLDAHLPVGLICLGGDVFVTKLSPDGLSIVYSTFISGNRFEVARAIAVDKAGNAYVTGLTNSTDFPNTNPLQKNYGGGDYDTFVVKVNPAGSALTYSTFLGGGNEDGGYGIGVDGAGNAYVAGITNSPNFPVAHGLPGRVRRPARTSSAFVTKIVDPTPAR